MRGTARLLTERLQLRRFREDDAEAAFRNWMSDPEVTRFLSWKTHPDQEVSRRTIAGWVSEYASGTMDWCITLRGSDEPIGSITVVREHPEKLVTMPRTRLPEDAWRNRTSGRPESSSSRTRRPGGCAIIGSWR